MKKIKIVYLANTRIPSQNAHAYQMSKMCESLGGSGAEVILLAPTRINDIEENVYDFYKLKKTFKTHYIALGDIVTSNFLSNEIGMRIERILFFFKSRKQIASLGGADFIYMRDPSLALMFKVAGYKTILEVHSMFSRFKKIFSWAVGLNDILITNSRGTKEELEKSGINKARVLPNGVDISEFDYKTNKNSLRKGLSLRNDKKIVLYSGRWHKWKGVDVFLEAASIAKRKGNKNIFFLMIGGTEDELHKYSSTTKGFQDMIHLTGFVKRDTALRYLRSADALVLPNIPISDESIYFTSPIKLFEYLASKTPVVASDLPSIRQLINENEVTFFRAGEATDLYNKINYVLENDMTQKIKNGYEKAIQNTWAGRADKVMSLLQI